MLNSSKLLSSLIVGAFFLLAGGMAFALDTGHGGPIIEERVERACHRMIESRSPHGQREMTTSSFELESARVGVAKGSLRTEFLPKRWSRINWTCRVHPKSGRVLRVEFEQVTKGSRLLAAARGL